MEMLAALLMMDQSSGRDTGYNAGTAPADGTEEETEQEPAWKKYAIPIGGAALLVGVAALLISSNNGGAKA